MAEKVTVELVDDLDGSAAAETVEFCIDGSSYQIDLSARNATKLREHLAAFISASRRANPQDSKENNAKRSTSAKERRQNRAIRDWARESGHPVADRGRIPHELIAQFQAARQAS